MAELKLIQMSDIHPEPVKWLWKPYIPSGAITLIQGDGGEGKTTLVLELAAAVSTGRALPGGGSTAPVGVVIQNAEDSYCKTIKPKLARFGANCGLIHTIDEDEIALSCSDERIEDAIVQIGAGLCILDPIQAYLGRANMNSAGGIRPLMKRLGNVAERTGCAILLVGHLNKGKSRSTYRGLGSIDIYAAARSVLTVGRMPSDESIRAVINNKNNLTTACCPQAFGIDMADRFSWLGERDITIDELLSSVMPKKGQFTKARRLIETALVNGPISAADIEQMAEEQGISAKTMNRAKSALGVISVKRGSQWYWEIPIEAEYRVVQEDGQHGQHGQDVSDDVPVTNMTALTIFNGTGG